MGRRSKGTKGKVSSLPVSVAVLLAVLVDELETPVVSMVGGAL